MTLKELKKLAKDNLIPFMKTNGFRVVNTMDFIKEGPESITYTIYSVLSYGGNLKVNAICHTPEMDLLTAKPFPKAISTMVGGRVKPGAQIAYENHYIWKVDTEEMALAALSEIQISIQESAFPFFESISDRKKLVDFIYPSMRVNNYAKVIEEIKKYPS